MKCHYGWHRDSARHVQFAANRRGSRGLSAEDRLRVHHRGAKPFEVSCNLTYYGAKQRDQREDVPPLSCSSSVPALNLWLKYHHCIYFTTQNILYDLGRVIPVMFYAFVISVASDGGQLNLISKTIIFDDLTET